MEALAGMDEERRRAQGARLRALRRRLGVSKARLLEPLGLETTNGYDLYERGQSVIRLNQIAAFAEVFGISEERFLEEVMSDPDPDWDLRAALDEILPTDPRYVAALVVEWSDHSVAIQKAMVEFLADLIRAGRFSVPPEHATCAPRRPDNPHVAEREESYAM